jgi:hypothetical protein
MHNLNVTHIEKNNILKKHNSVHASTYLFENEITVDGRFLLFQDNIFDLKQNKLIGNISESINNFIFLLENVVFPKDQDYSFLIETKNLLKTNILNESYFDYQIIIEQAKQEKSWLERGKEWAGQKVQQGITTVKDYANKAEKILKEKGLMSLIGASALFIGRKIKSWLWSVQGMLVDAFLVASGLGKSVQWVPWAIAFLTDVYQWASGDYGDDTDFKESSTLWKILTLSFEVLGMLSAGPVALAARKLFGPVKAFKSESQILTWVSKNPAAQKTLQQVQGLLGSVSGKLSSLKNTFSKSFPKLSEWIGKTLSSVGGFIKKIAGFLGRILSAPGKLAKKAGDVVQKTTKINPKYNIGAGTQAAVNTGMVIGGVNVGMNQYANYQQKKQEDELIQGIEKADLSNFEF